MRLPTISASAAFTSASDEEGTLASAHMSNERGRRGGTSGWLRSRLGGGGRQTVARVSRERGEWTETETETAAFTSASDEEGTLASAHMSNERGRRGGTSGWLRSRLGGGGRLTVARVSRERGEWTETETAAFTSASDGEGTLALLQVRT